MKNLDRKLRIGKSFYRKVFKSSLPEDGSEVSVLTKYNKKHICVFNYPKYKVVNDTFSLGISEIVKWEYTDGKKKK